MIVATRYTLEKDSDSDVWRVRNLDAPFCPSCGSLCSGYDTRKRHSIDGAGRVRWFALRRLLCPSCGQLHTETPDFMWARKHYDAQAITDAIQCDGGGDSPADDSTVRRWKRENHPPGLPVSVNLTMIDLSNHDNKGAET